MSVLNSIRNDIKVTLKSDPAAHGPIEVLLAYPGFHARQLHRLAHTLHNAGVPVLPRVISHFSRWITGIEIHPGAQIGEGLFIDHGMGIVIGETTIIGDNCSLLQGVTLGGTSTRREKRHPTLLEGVSVGAGAKVIGAVTLGEYSRIGAGSVVVTSVPAYATVVGVPGHVVAYYDPGNGTTVRLPDPEWDRIDELTAKLDDLRARVVELETELKEHSTAITGHGPLDSI
jgi:serine O-acetyltransferase